MIPWIIDIIMQDETFAPLRALTFSKRGNKFINRIDLVQIQNKAKTYKSVHEFRTDISWVVHNCAILDPEKIEIKNEFSQLVEYVDSEILDVSQCVHCYENAYHFKKSSFVMTCVKLHKIIWAQMEGFNFWPAKILSVNDGIVHVRFFGDHTLGDIPNDKCFLFSEQPPDYDPTKLCISESYSDALKVSN